MKPTIRLRTADAGWPRALAVPALVFACVLAGGCSLLGAKSREPTTIYAPEVRVAPEPSWPTVAWQLTISPPQAARMIDSLRIAVRPTPGELQVYKGANWSRPPTQLLEDAVLHALEDSGRIAAVARQGSGVDGDYRLLLDVRRFEADYAGAPVPSAVIEVNAKLLHPVQQRVVATRTFSVQRPASGTAVPEVVAAFEPALAQVTAQLCGWVLEQGQRSALATGTSPATR